MPDVSATLKLGFEGLREDVQGLDKQVRDAIRAQQDRYRGVKHLRLPLIQATGANPFSAGEGSGIMVGPLEGFAWCVTRLCIFGLTTGATPDVVNIFRGSSLQEGGFLWQLNGNSPGVTFGNGELVLMPGDRLQLASQGTFAATGQITLSGEVNEVPAEMLAKLLLGGGS
jgi:hypothetical protein